MIREFSVVYHMADGRVEWTSGTPIVQNGCEAIASGPGSVHDIIDRYRAHGEGFGLHLPQETSFVIWDRAARTLACGMDQAGLRPLYFRKTSETFAFSTGISALSPRRFDPKGLGGFLAGIPDPGLSCFDRIRPAPTTSIVFVRRDQLSTRDRTSPPGSSPRPLPEMLEEAVRRRLPEGPFGCALSGGLDSALVLAHAPPRARVYTMAPDRPEYSELDAASLTAAHLKREIIRVPIEGAALVSALPKAIRAIEAPIFNLHAVSKLLMARAVRADHLEVLLGGEGADEAFGVVTPAAADLDLAPVLREDFPLPCREEGGTAPAGFPVLVLGMLDALCSSVGVEIRLPFLDPGLAGLGENLPPDRRRDKAALRELADSLLPAAIARRPKRPMLAPPVDFYSQYLRDEAIERCGVFKTREVHELYARFQKTPDNPRLDRAMMRIVTTLLLYEQLIAPCAG